MRSSTLHPRLLWIATIATLACTPPQYDLGRASGTGGSSTGGESGSAGELGGSGGSAAPDAEAGTTSLGGTGGGTDQSAAGAGATNASSGGSSGAGGQLALAGGPASGGTNATGGAIGSGGLLGSGGTATEGGTGAEGGAGADGGAVTEGGAGADSGSVTEGGAGAGGGTEAQSGSTASGGTTASGGSITSGGSTASGGSITSGGSTASGGTTTSGGSTADPDLVLWYKFDETSGTSAADSSGNARTGTLVATGGSGSAEFSTSHQVGTGSVNLTSTSTTEGGYITIPASLLEMGATTEITIACWVNVTTLSSWSRVFDFGSSSTTGYMFLTVQEGVTTPYAPRFAITQTDRLAEQVINMSSPSPLSTGAWHHLAVVLAAGAIYTGTLYIDGAAVGSNAAMTLRPSDLGDTTQNWLGRSQFTTADPLFSGMLDDFRIYKRALSASEVSTLYAER